jgi:hypothetical protein
VYALNAEGFIARLAATNVGDSKVSSRWQDSIEKNAGRLALFESESEGWLMSPFTAVYCYLR